MLIQRMEAEWWGSANITPGEPTVRELKDVYYTPHIDGGRWGLFDADDVVIPELIEWWLQHKLPLRQEPVSPIKYDDVSDSLPDADYFYGGRVVNHFGHFIIESLARLWPLADGGLRGRKLLLHGDGQPSDWWAIPFVREIYSSLGIALEDIVHASTPVRVGRVTVPELSFRPQASAHPAFQRLCREIGRRLLAAHPGAAPSGAGPVYLSKSKLEHGVGRFVSEPVIERVMREAGIQIMHPQLMPLVEKIRLFGQGRIISGTAMSGHHISIFGEAPGRIEFLNTYYLNSNFPLIDRLNNNKARYWYSDDTFEVNIEGATFLKLYDLADPRAAALALIERF